MALVAGLFALSYLISVLLGLPSSFALPPPVTLLGGAVFVAGLAMAVWTFTVRRPDQMILSTYATIAKALRRAPGAGMAGRTEPLVVRGPQRYTRNPLYFGVVLAVLGWGVFAASPSLLVAALVFLVWFVLVLIPYEERELKALFGEEWVKYSDETPMLVPFTKRKKSSSSQGRADSFGSEPV